MYLLSADGKVSIFVHNSTVPAEVLNPEVGIVT
jgi:hypothetical protein